MTVYLLLLVAVDAVVVVDDLTPGTNSYVVFP
jgi:hypothetical protein